MKKMYDHFVKTGQEEKAKEILLIKKHDGTLRYSDFAKKKEEVKKAKN